MSTRSVIAIQNPNKTITGVYCHSDGYVSYNGKILVENYSDETKIKKLLENGGISSLDKRIGTKHDFNNRPRGETTFYHRDRGESLEIHTWKNSTEMFKEMDGCEFFYVWNGKEWLVSEGLTFDKVISLLYK